MAEWVPFELVWNDAPLDLSFLYADERPAGRHGFLTTAADSFAFEDGTPARFWGVNFNSGANFPTHAEAEQVARRLAKFGVNLVRCHQMDADWATPNLFQFSRAEPLPNTRALDERSLERLDYLIACLKAEGIYVYLDLLTYRQFLPGDDVRSAAQLGAAAKPYTCFDPHLIALQKEFNEALWTHVNPHTRLAYKDEPAIVLTEIANEDDLFLRVPAMILDPALFAARNRHWLKVEPYRTELEGRFMRWLEERGERVDVPVDFAAPDARMAAFFVDLHVGYYREMYAHLRELGVRIPITGTNWTKNLGLVESQREMDFTDTHWYWNFPTWETEAGTDARPMVKSDSTGFANAVIQRTLDRPFFVSEWDHAWPDEWRAESPVWYAAIGALQDWGGFAIHAYRYTSYGPVDRIGGGATTVDGVTYRNHFDTFNDPSKFGLFYAAALLFRRGDVQPARERAALRVGEEGDGAWRLFTPKELPAADLLAEVHRAGVVLPGAENAVEHEIPVTASQFTVGDEIRSDTGEVGRDRRDGVGWIDTPRTKAVYGFVGRRPVVGVEGFELAMTTDFATVVVSSLSNLPVRESDRLLITAVGRSDNTDARYDAERKRQLGFGRAPVLVEAVEGDVGIATERNDLNVWVIGSHGEAVVRLPTERTDGWLRFRIGPQPSWNPSTIYYLVRP